MSDGHVMAITARAAPRGGAMPRLVIAAAIMAAGCVTPESVSPGPDAERRPAMSFHLVLPPAAPTDSRAAGSAGPRDGRLQVGFPRSIPPPYDRDVAPLLTWDRARDGHATAAFAVTSPSASGLRLALAVRQLPEGFELRFFELTSSPRIFGPFTRRDILGSAGDRSALAAEAVYWSPVVDGDTIGVELRLRDASQEAALHLRLIELSHLTAPR
jgi:hypothetical protein